jgi:D-alanine transaminase
VSEIVYLNGAWLPRPQAVVSVDDRGFLFGDGVYEVVRVVDGRYVDGDRHFGRLGRSLAELELPDPAAAGVDLRAVGRELLERQELAARGEAVVYIQVTRGSAPRRHAFPPPGTAPTVFAAATPFVAKTEKATGVPVITCPDIRWGRCDIKSVNLLANVLANQRAAGRGAYEAILVRDGLVTEATHSSVFAVVGGVLRTHPNGPAILPGVTRGVILELAAEAGLEASEEAVTAAELGSAEEVLLTGTTTDVMPVTRIDGKAVGTGRPGPVTRRLSALLAARMPVS